MKTNHLAPTDSRKIEQPVGRLDIGPAKILIADLPDVRRMERSDMENCVDCPNAFAPFSDINAVRDERNIRASQQVDPEHLMLIRQTPSNSTSDQARGASDEYPHFPSLAAIVSPDRAD